MTISIYPGQMPGRPIETHPWAGSIAAWFAAAGIDYEAHQVQPVTLSVNGAVVPPERWADTVVSQADDVQIRPIPRGGVFKALGSIVSKVFNIFFGWLTPKAKAAGGTTTRGSNLESAEAVANTAKPNAVVPELLGRFQRFPDYLVQPRRYFADPRTQYLELLLCLGPGVYDVESVQIGNTALADLAGAEYTIHQPGADLSAYTQRLNWYGAAEVGSTSGGTAGLELSAVPDSAVAPSGASYLVSGNTISIPAGVAGQFPAAWGAGTQMGLMFAQDVVVERVEEGDTESTVIYNTFAADWREINPTAGLMLTMSGAGLSGSVQVSRMVSGKLVLSRYVGDDEGGSPIYGTVANLEPGLYRIAATRAGRTYSVVSVGDTQATVVADDSVPGGADFPARTVSAAESSWNVLPDTVYGETAGPFVVCPASERTTAFEVDFFFPAGLCFVADDGAVHGRSVGVEISWRPAGTGAAWQSVSRWYTNATMDQIGYTERIDGLAAGRYQVRVRRRGAASTSTQVNDKLQWYGLRSLLVSPAAYPAWTTMTVRLKGMGQIAATSENQVSVVATRHLPTLQVDGSWSAPQATRDVSAAMRYIAHSVGYTDADLDMAEVQRLHAVWKARGETLDYVFDETTVKGALDVALGAGMSELTVDDGLLRPVRDGLRTVFEQGYSSQNTTQGIVRAFSAPRPDDNDGVEVEYVDADDSWTSKTVPCVVDGSPGIKLEKLKLAGVVSRDRAWRIGMRRALDMRLRRWQYSFTTELDALNSSYGSYVGLACDVPGFGQSAILEDIAGGEVAAQLRVSEPLDWADGQAHVIGIRRLDGTLAGPYAAQRGADAFSLTVTGIAPADWPTPRLDMEPPHVFFGTTARWTLPALVTQVSPDGMESVKVTAKNYHPGVYANDDATAPL